MTCPAFLRLITQKSQASLGLYSLQISCHVKPNVAAGHAGVTRVGTDRVDISVSVAPRENAANAAVSEIIAEVLKVPKSNVGVIRGLKAREKVLAITDLNLTQGSEEVFLQEATEKLMKAVKKSRSK
ncbi:hypothetical protein N7450_006139 [Penicillium hetheringtonii]|uniref:YggU-like protein n=1 Tax=Penicillium hetheringtonii TaxID=911720 RepID=A0AAD6DKG0_9EURO|nr:hypothetical protein N7450_006139 [Penicillium hetheringtonii]